LLTVQGTKNILCLFFQNDVYIPAVIFTDFWRGYLGLKELNYTHMRINHSIEFVAGEDHIGFFLYFSEIS
jgi:hypothetical protein